MVLPKTSKIVAALSAGTAAAVAWGQSAFHWTGSQIATTSAASVAVVALLGFIVEHVRKETTSRWVGMLGMIPPTATTVATMGIAFAWWGESAFKVSTYIIGGVTVLAALAGVTIAQAEVYSPETHLAELTTTAQEVAAAKAATPDHAQ